MAKTQVQRAIEAQKVLIRKLEQEEKDDVAATQAAVEAAMARAKGDVRSGARVFSELKVTWKEDGKHRIVDLPGDHAPADFWKVVSMIPQAVGRTSAQGSEPFVPRNQLIRDYRRRAEQRRTKIFHCNERILDLQAGGR